MPYLSYNTILVYSNILRNDLIIKVFLLSHFNSDCKFEKGLLAKTELEDAARSLKAIAHPIRLQILCKLGTDEVCVQEIVNAIGTSQSNISQHLGVMRDKGVLVARKVANRVFYRIQSDPILRLVGKKETEVTTTHSSH